MTVTEWDAPIEILAMTSGALAATVFITKILAYSRELKYFVLNKDSLNDPIAYVGLIGIIAAVWLYKIIQDRSSVNTNPH